MRFPPGSVARAVATAAAWTALLGLFPVLTSFVGSMPDQRAFMLHALPSYALWGLLGVLPFTVFAGGAAVYGPGERRRLGLLALLLVGGVFVLTDSYIAPAIHHHYQVTSPSRDPSSQALAAGPRTLSRLIELRAHIEANPPDSYTFDGREPFRTPPNFLTFLIHSHLAVPVLLVLNGLLGWAVATRIPRRGSRKALWGVWVTALVSFMLGAVLLQWSNNAVRRDLGANGALYAWLPIVVWALLVGALWPRRPRNGRGDTP